MVLQILKCLSFSFTQSNMLYILPRMRHCRLWPYVSTATDYRKWRNMEKWFRLVALELRFRLSMWIAMSNVSCVQNNVSVEINDPLHKPYYIYVAKRMGCFNQWGNHKNILSSNSWPEIKKTKYEHKTLNSSYRARHIKSILPQIQNYKRPGMCVYDGTTDHIT